MICRHFGVCGGCSLPGIPYAEQLRRKQAQLEAWFPGTATQPIVASPLQSRFRHKVAFVFATGRGGLVMGHYRAGSRQVVPVEECPVHSDRGNQLAFALRDRLAAARIPQGVLKHVLVRTTDDEREAVVMLVVAANHRSLRAPVRAFLEGGRPPDGFFLNIHQRDDPFMVGRETIRLSGRSHVREEVAGTRFLISPTAFFQTNVRAARSLLQLVLTHATGAARVLDLYSGSGLFALPLARGGARVTAIEDNHQAMKDADANLRLNRIPVEQVRLVPRRVEDALTRLSRESFDLVVLDPPRQGCPDAVVDRVCALEPVRIVYVSCNPGKLATEQRQFRNGGFRLTEIRGVDMFPHTGHIEAVAVFDRQTNRSA